MQRRGEACPEAAGEAQGLGAAAERSSRVVGGVYKCASTNCTSSFDMSDAVVALSIAETNKLRASLGLGPLRAPASAEPAPAAPAASSSAANDKSVAARVEKARRKRALHAKLAGPTLGDDDFPAANGAGRGGEPASKEGGAKRAKQTSEQLSVSASQVGASGIMVLQDSLVLDGDELAEADAELVALETGGRLGSKPPTTIDSDDDDDGDKPFAPQGARLVLTSSVPAAPQSDIGAAKKAPRAKKASAAPVAIPKIERRAGRRSARRREEEEDMSDVRMNGGQDEEEEEDDLEASLARARRANLALAAPSQSIADRVAAAPPAAPMDGEVFVLGSFARVESGAETSAAAAVAAAAREEAIAHDDEEMSVAAPSAADASSSSSSSSRLNGTSVTMAPPSAVAGSAAATPAATDAPKPKPTFRGLASSLAALYESGNLTAEDEVIVGRTRDTKPDLGLNRPGEKVVLEYRDDHGRLLTPKEAYRQLAYQFRGSGPSAKKKELRQDQLRREEKLRSAAAGDTPLNMASATNK
jgi:hypothetical protein